jgi:hypothetical protein
VYYISGFDPRGAAFYHRLYRDEASKQSHHLEAKIEVGPRMRSEPHVSGWTIRGDWQGTKVSTQYRFLGWDDIVRRHWESNAFRLFLSCVSGYLDYIACGALGRVGKTFRGPLLSAIYPLLYMLVLSMCVVLGALAAWWITDRAFESVAAAWAVAAATAAALTWGGMQLAHQLGIFWLLRTYLFVYICGTRGVEALDRRIAGFAARIARDQNEAPCDEVLLVGHSVGTIVAASVAARLVRDMEPDKRANITLITLGHCIPLLSLLPSATAFNQELRTLAQAKDLPWLDMAARADALCFSQANLLKASGIGDAANERPTAQPVRPFRMFRTREYARIKRNKLRLHFQYLMASDIPNEYDYFRMTAGPARIQPY